MRTSLPKRLLLLVIPVSIAVIAQGQKAYTLKSSKLTIDGTSSVHDWTSETKKLEWVGTATVDGQKVIEIKGVVVKIPVTSIKSTKGKTMDNKTYEAFRSKDNPKITYQLSAFAMNGDSLKATGSLTMAGVTKEISMTVLAKVQAAGEIKITGRQKINMTDYKMTPPTAVLGTIKVGPVVTVNFDLIIAPSK